MKLEGIDIDNVMEMAKDTVKQYGDHIPTFILCRANGEMMIVGAQYDERDKAAFKSQLKSMIDSNDVVRYAQIVTAWMANTDNIKEAIREVVEQVNSAEDIRQMLEEVREFMKPPSENPLKKEILAVLWYEKCGNQDQRIIEISRTESNKPVFGESVDIGGQGRLFNYWNVWEDEGTEE